MPNTPTRVGVVDDTPLLRRGLRSLLLDTPNLSLAFEAASPKEAIECIEQQPVDLIICEVAFRGHEGIFELLRDLECRGSHLPVLAFSHFDERMIATRVLKAGAQGYLMKSAEPSTLLDAVNRLILGRVYLSSAMTEFTLGRLSGPTRNSSDPNHTDILTNRELEVLELVGDGRASKEIAAALHISLKTIESHRANIRFKLGLENSAELICYASKWRAEADGRSSSKTKSPR